MNTQKTTCRILPSLIVIVAAGCVETDGQPVMHEIQPSAPCPSGVPERKAIPPDLIDAFPQCCNGAARLIPDYLIPEDFRSRLAPGPAGTDTLCVPLEFATDAAYTPKPCISVFGLHGACLSACLPEVTDQQIQLPPADCPPGQLCAPCTHPQTGEVTGACSFGAMACDPPEATDDCTPWQPTLDLSQFTSCCPEGRAHCAPSELVEANQAKDLSLCADGTSFCVPDDILARGGKHQPPPCESVGGREGRCLSICVKSVAEQLDLLPQSSCKPDERCAPCYDPRTGAGTGACTFGPCDEPAEPPMTFAACGAGADDAFCIPADLVPLEDRCHFDAKGCSAGCQEPGTICVPKTVMDAGPTYTPKTCKASMSGFLALFMTIFTNPFDAFNKMDEYSQGVCISKCLPQVRDNPSASMLSSKGCADDELCIPCYDPQKLSQGKVSTGACDRATCQ